MSYIYTDTASQSSRKISDLLHEASMIEVITNEAELDNAKRILAVMGALKWRLDVQIDRLTCVVQAYAKAREIAEEQLSNQK